MSMASPSRPTAIGPPESMTKSAPDQIWSPSYRSGRFGRQRGEEPPGGGVVREHQRGDPQLAGVDSRSAGDRRERRAVGPVRHLHDVGTVVVRAVRAHEAQVHRLRAGAEQLAGAPTASCPPSRRGTRAIGRSRRRARATRCSRTRDRSPRRGPSGRSTAASNASSAPTTSSRSIPRSRARWFLVPAGITTMGMPRSAAMLATSACDPSPPAMPMTSAPRSIASRARSSMSSPGWSTTGSMPRVRHSSARWNFSAFPPPDFRFMISTPCSAAGTGVPVVALLLSVRTSRESAYRASATATTRRASRHTTDHTADSETTIAATNATAATPNATATMRAVPARVSAYHTASTMTTSSANTATSGPTRSIASTTVEIATTTTSAIDRIAATRRGSAGFELVVAVRTRPPPPPAPQDPTPRPRPRHRSGAGLPWDDTIASHAG